MCPPEIHWKLRMSRAAQDFTKVTFYPDLKRFGMSKLDKAGY